MSKEFRQQYVEEKELIRHNVFKSLYIKYIHNSNKLKIVSINVAEIIFLMGDVYFYFDIENGRATTKTDVRHLNKELKQFMEVLAEELCSPMYRGWEIARSRRARDKYFSQLETKERQPELLPESACHQPAIDWDLSKAHTVREEYQKQAIVEKRNSISVQDIELLSFSTTRVRFLVGDSVLNFLEHGLYDPTGKQWQLLPTRLHEAFTKLAQDIITACRAGGKRQQRSRSDAQTRDKLDGPQKVLLFD